MKCTLPGGKCSNFQEKTYKVYTKKGWTVRVMTPWDLNIALSEGTILQAILIKKEMK